MSTDDPAIDTTDPAIDDDPFEAIRQYEDAVERLASEKDTVEGAIARIFQALAHDQPEQISRSDARRFTVLSDRDHRDDKGEW